MAGNGLEVNNFTTNNQAAKKQAEAAAKASGTGTNPSSQLDKDAFMKLLLTELRYQDPTSPMDTEKMLTQTSQLAALETQQSTNQMMKKLADQLKTNTNMYAVGVLGKIAKIGDNTLNLSEKGSPVSFSTLLDKAATKGTVTIKDASGNVVKTAQFEKLKAGVNKFTWDGKNNSGIPMKPGTYKAEVKYTDEFGKEHDAGIGTYKVEGIKFVNGEAQIKVAGQYIGIDKVKEFMEPEKAKS
ncbi:MAG: flagellar basal body rod modification protein [Campylobacter sp.]